VLGRHCIWVNALAIPTDRRVVTGGSDGRVLVCDPAAPGTSLVEPARADGSTSALAVLTYGRLVTGLVEGRVLVWDATFISAGSFN
jgi:hypothetical protein